jgi:hypothetical protein
LPGFGIRDSDSGIRGSAFLSSKLFESPSPEFWIPDPRPRFDRQLSADDRAQPCLFRRFMKTRRSVHTIGIEERQCRIAERRRTLDERFGQ